MIPLRVGDGFVVTVDLERRFSFHVDASIGIVRRWFSERTGSDAMTRHAFRFGIVYILLESLNVALVGRQVDVFSADVTFSPSALVVRDTAYLGV